jgi:arginase
VRRVEYTVFCGRAGDRNDLAMAGAEAIGATLRERSGVEPVVIGNPDAPLTLDWRAELDAALPHLRQLQARIDEVMARSAFSVAIMGRCSVAMATLPAVARHHPGVCVIWFDAHGDLNTPEASTTGYLGGLALAAPLGLWASGLGAGLGLDQIVLVGQRDLDPFEQALIDQHRIPHLAPGPDLAEALRAAIRGRPVYVHLDCDVLEPGIVPTDYMHPGGLSLADLHRCCEVIAEGQVVGLEIAEFQLSWTPAGPAASPGPLLDALGPLLRG